MPALEFVDAFCAFPAYGNPVKFGVFAFPTATSTMPTSGEPLITLSVPREGANGFTLDPPPLHAANESVPTAPSTAASALVCNPMCVPFLACFPRNGGSPTVLVPAFGHATHTSRA